LTTQTQYLRERDILPQREITEAEVARNREELAKAIANGDADAIRKLRSKPRRARHATSGILRISKATFWGLVKSGEITAIKLSPRTTVFDVAQIHALIASKAQ